LYYTLFGVDGLLVLGEEPEREKLLSYLKGFGEGQDLDLVHLACLARCWTRLDEDSDGQSPLPHLLESLERMRRHAEPSIYSSFLVFISHEDAGVSLADPADFLRSWLLPSSWKSGMQGNITQMVQETTTLMAAVLVMESALMGEVSKERSDWLLRRQCPSGGFLPHPGAPMPDLLSTAVAVYALRRTGMDHKINRRSCLGFVEAHWNEDGGFQASLIDSATDVEYTFYGLLALGALL